MSNTVEPLDASTVGKPELGNVRRTGQPGGFPDDGGGLPGEMTVGRVIPAPGALNTAAEVATEIIKANINKTTDGIELKPIDFIAHTLKQAGVTDAAIQELAKSKDLTINGVEDKAGYKAVDEARKKCVKMRGIIKAKCEDGRAPLIEMSKIWIENEKNYTKRIEEIEKPLKERQKTIDDALEEIKRKAEAEERERINLRVKELFEAGHILSYEVCAVMTPTEYIEALETARQKKAEADRVKAAEETQRALERQKAIDEAERIRKEREDFEREKAEFEAEKKKAQALLEPVPEEKPVAQEEELTVQGGEGAVVTRQDTTLTVVRMADHQEALDYVAIRDYARQLNDIPMPQVLSRRGQRSVSNIVVLLKDLEENLAKNWESL